MHKAHNSSPYIEIDKFTFLLPKQHSLSLPLVVNKGDSLSALAIDGDRSFLDDMTRSLMGIYGESGRIELFGSDTDKPKISCVSHNGPLYAHLSCDENIVLPLRLGGHLDSRDIDRRLQSIKALLGLYKLNNMSVDSLTSCQAFRVKLARALVQQSFLVIFNQILLDFTPKEVQETLLLLDRLKRSVGLTYLFLTCHRRYGFMASPRTALFEKGRVVQIDKTVALLDKPCNAHVARALADSNILTANVLHIGDDIATLHLSCGARVETTATEGLQEGSLARVAIAPARISLLPVTSFTSGEEEGTIRAVLISSFHLGDVIVMRMRLKDGTEMMVHRSPFLQKRPLKLGAEALLAWQPQNALAFPA